LEGDAVRTIRWINGGVVAAFGALLISACGGSSSTPSPTPAPGGGSGATVTITSAEVNPSQVTISVGQTVTFVNNDSTSHDIESDPHPAHTDCPAIAQVG
jgi:plastocyanin